VVSDELPKLIRASRRQYSKSKTEETLHKLMH